MGEHVILLSQHVQGEHIDTCARFREKKPGILRSNKSTFLPKLVEGNPPDENCLKNYGEWLPKEFGGKEEMDGTELVKSILAEKDYLEQLRRTCDYNVHV